MLEPTEIETGDRVTVEFDNVHGKKNELAKWDWFADEIVEADDGNETLVWLRYAGDSKASAETRIVFDHTKGRWRIERQNENGTWWTWSDHGDDAMGCDVRPAKDAVEA